MANSFALQYLHDTAAHTALLQNSCLVASSCVSVPEHLVKQNLPVLASVYNPANPPLNVSSFFQHFLHYISHPL